MEALLAGFFVLLMIAIFAFMVLRTLKGKPLFSLLHFFLFGFVLFQVSSAALMLGFKQYGETGISRPGDAGVVYAGLILIFLSVFALGWKTRTFTFGLQRKLGSNYPVPASVTMFAIAFGVFGFAILFRFVLAFVPVFSALALIMAAALCSTAVGLAAWAWSRQWGNPIYFSMFVSLLAGCGVMSIYQNFGRRDLASVLIAAVWGAYQGHFKHVPFRRAALPFATVGLIGLVTLAAYTSTRTERAVNLSLDQTITRLFSANLLHGLLDMAGGQEAAGYSMYIVETRPEGKEYDTLHSLIYATTHWVPRVFWDSKLQPLGLTLVPEIGITRKSPGYNVGPGMIGHVVNDNPWICLWLYPLLLAGYLRVCDDLIERFPLNPFVVVPMGVVLAEITAWSRGELGLFVFRTTVAIITSYVFLWLTARILTSFGMRFRTLDQSQTGHGAHTQYIYEEYADAPEYDRYAEER